MKPYGGIVPFPDDGARVPTSLVACPQQYIRSVTDGIMFCSSAVTFLAVELRFP